MTRITCQLSATSTTVSMTTVGHHMHVGLVRAAANAGAEMARVSLDGPAVFINTR